MNLLADELRVGVEARNYAQTVLFEPAVTEKCLSELSRPDEHGLLFLVVAHEALDVADEVGDVVADFGLSLAHHRHGEVLFHDGGIFLHDLGEPYRRDVFLTLRLSPLEIAQIAGHTLESRH